MLFVAAFLALARFAVAQDSDAGATATDIALVQANFNNAQLVPDLLQRFNPEGTLSVSFSGSAIEIGQLLAQDAVGSAPTLSLLASSDGSEINGDNRYTVMMIDADIVGTNALNTPLTRHWLVNGAALSASSAPYQVTFDSATTITDYAGPGPAEGSGPHRYTLLVYVQPSNFTAPADLSQAGTPLGTMLLNDYVTSSGLGDLVAANYFQVENGQATVSVIQTSTVNPSALGGITTTGMSASATSAASMSSSGPARSASMSDSGSMTSGSAAAASSSGAAKPNREMGWSVAVGAVGVAGAVLGAGLGF